MIATKPSRSSLRIVSVAQASPILLERTALLAWNASEKGDSDVLPWMTEFRILRGFTHELAEVAWAQERPAGVETVQAPLSALTVRNVQLMDPITFLRFGGSVLALADYIEASRVPPTLATAVRWSPNRSRGRIILPGSFQRWEAALSKIEDSFPYVLELDLAAFFPSVRMSLLRDVFAPDDGRRLLVLRFAPTGSGRCVLDGTGYAGHAVARRGLDGGWGGTAVAGGSG